MDWHLKLYVMLCGFILCGPSLAFTYTFTAIDVPGVYSTHAHEINDAGQIVGRFADATGSHGFLLSGGSFSTIDVPGATFTEARGINDAGQIVGIFLDVTGTHGFLLSGGTFSTIDVPGATFTEARGINDAGQIVGIFLDVTGTHGFLLRACESNVHFFRGQGDGQIHLLGDTLACRPMVAFWNGRAGDAGALPAWPRPQLEGQPRRRTRLPTSFPASFLPSRACLGCRSTSAVKRAGLGP